MHVPFRPVFAVMLAAALVSPASAATVHPTFMMMPRVLTPDLPRFQHLGTDRTACVKEKRLRTRANKSGTGARSDCKPE